MPDIVLLHGTTQTAAGYWRLVDELTARHHWVTAVDLPGRLGSVREYAEFVASQVQSRVHRPIVVAHSGSGILLPAVAQRLDAVHQVWLAAAVADYARGRSFLTELRSDPTRVFAAEWYGADPTKDPVLATYFLFHDADLATLRSALRTVAPLDLSTVFDQVPDVDPAGRASTYVQPGGDRTLQSSWMAHVARERLGVEPRVLDGGHNMHVANAAAVAAIIDDVAGAESARPTT